MITEIAKVISIENNQTWIETQRKSACGQCSASKGCGTSVLAKVVGNKLALMPAINRIDAKVGDEVIIGLNESSLLKGAYITYLQPLLFLFIFAVAGKFISDAVSFENEWLVIVFSCFGFYLGLRQIKLFSRSISDNENYQPVILKKSGSNSVFVNL